MLTVAAGSSSKTSTEMASFDDLTTPQGLKSLDEYLLHRSYIEGYV